MRHLWRAPQVLGKLSGFWCYLFLSIDWLTQIPKSNLSLLLSLQAKSQFSLPWNNLHGSCSAYSARRSNNQPLATAVFTLVISVLLSGSVLACQWTLSLINGQSGCSLLKKKKKSIIFIWRFKHFLTCLVQNMRVYHRWPSSSLPISSLTTILESLLFPPVPNEFSVMLCFF